jgi:hypothetical protein
VDVLLRGLDAVVAAQPISLMNGGYAIAPAFPGRSIRVVAAPGFA